MRRAGRNTGVPDIDFEQRLAQAGLELHRLDDCHTFHHGRLDEELRLDGDAFESLWNVHPADYHEIKMHGRLVKTPRWQQAYGADYHYTGNVNKALPVPDLLKPLHAWCRDAIDDQLNGILLNWYDAQHKHYIGKHRDSTTNMVPDSPIVTISFGATRKFRLRPWRSQGFVDFTADDGSIFVIPYATNLAWTHEVPHSGIHGGRRISVTLRAFESEEFDGEND